MTKKEKLLNVSDVSELLGGIHTQSVYNMALNGEIPSLKIGRRVRFKESEILAWIENKTRRPNHAEGKNG